MPRTRWLILLVLLLTPVFIFITVNYLASFAIPQESDFFVSWLGAYVVRIGQSPYQVAAWTAAYTTFHADWFSATSYWYPPHLALLVAPLTLLAFNQAYGLWMVLLQIAILTSLLLLMSSWKIASAKRYLLPLMLGLAVFRPTLLSVRTGQLGGMLLLAVALAIWCWEHDRWFLGGVFIAFLAFKTTFSVPILLLVTLWLLASRRWQALLGLTLMALALTVIDLPYLGQWLTALSTNDVGLLSISVGISPTIWGVAHTVCGLNQPCATILGGLGTILLAGGLAIVLCRQRRQLRPLTALSLIIPVGLLIVPYLWAYDQILLVVPITYIVQRLIERRAPFMVSALFFFAVSILAILLLMLANTLQADVWSATLSALIFGLVIWLMRFTPSERPRPILAQPIASQTPT